MRNVTGVAICEYSHLFLQRPKRRISSFPYRWPLWHKALPWVEVLRDLKSEKPLVFERDMHLLPEVFHMVFEKGNAAPVTDLKPPPSCNIEAK